MINYSKFIPQLEKMTNVIKTHLGKFVQTITKII